MILQFVTGARSRSVHTSEYEGHLVPEIARKCPVKVLAWNAVADFDVHIT